MSKPDEIEYKIPFHENRGKRVDNDEWVYGCFIKTDLDAPAIVIGDGEQYEIIPDTVGQYTGFKDWFQGDIIEDQRSKIKFEIVWNPKFLGWWSVSEYKTVESALGDLKNHCKKVGTIHD